MSEYTEFFGEAIDLNAPEPSTACVPDLEMYCNLTDLSYYLNDPELPICDCPLFNNIIKEPLFNDNSLVLSESPKRPIDVLKYRIQGSVIGQDNGKWSIVQVEDVEKYISEVGQQIGTLFKKTGGKVYGAAAKMRSSKNGNSRAHLLWTQAYRCVGQNETRCAAKIVVSVYKNNHTEALIREYHQHNHPLRVANDENK
jgi:hypothetical protein